MNLTQDVEKLRKVPMFAKLEPSRLKLLAFASESITFDDGDTLFKEGDPGDAAYVIMQGAVDIIADTGEGEVVAGTLPENALIGELAVLTNENRTATLRAHGDLRALRISEDIFLKLLAENPAVALDVIRQLSDKLVRTHRKYVDSERELQKLQGEANPEVTVLS